MSQAPSSLGCLLWARWLAITSESFHSLEDDNAADRFVVKPAAALFIAINTNGIVAPAGTMDYRLIDPSGTIYSAGFFPISPADEFTIAAAMPGLTNLPSQLDLILCDTPVTNRFDFPGGGGNGNNPQVSGQVSLEGFVGSTRTVVFQSADASGTGLATFSLPLTFAGGEAHYSLSVPAGTARLSAKTAWTLRKRLVLTFAGNMAVANFTGANLLPAGDINGDNVVNTAD